jgi:hypothetical protein
MHNMKKYIPKFTGGGESPAKRAGFEPLPKVNASKLNLPSQTEQINAVVSAITKAPVQDLKLELAKPDEPAMNGSNKDAQKMLKKAEKNANKSMGNPLGLSEPGLSTMSGVSKGLSMATNIASNFIDVDEDSNFSGQQAVGNALMSSGNPYAMAAGAA